MTQAYKSAIDLSFDVRAGLVMRQIHHWAALLFLAAIVVHLMRIFFTGAFRRPRELNWIIGVVLLILAIFNGFAGYSLLDDQLSGTGLRIAYSIALSIPVAGHVDRLAAVRRRVPGPRHHQPALRHPHPAHPGADRGSARRAPRHPRASEAHAVPGQGAARGQRGRRAGVAGVRGQGPGLVLHHRRAAVWPRWPGPDQPHLVVRAVRSRRGQLRVAAGLVHGVARRRAAHHAELRDPRLRVRDTQPVLPCGAAGRRDVHAPVRLAVPRGALHRRSGRPPSARSTARPCRCGRRSAWPRSRSTWCSRSSRRPTCCRPRSACR